MANTTQPRDPFDPNDFASARLVTPESSWSTVDRGELQDGLGDETDGEVMLQEEPTWQPVQLESAILAILQRPRDPGERIEMAFRRKEAELTACFERLSVADAAELHRRLRIGFPDDQLNGWFVRLLPDRRQRLFSFLADARRREAIRAWNQR